MRNAFHQAAVAQEHIGVVVDDVVPGAVELAGQGALGDGEADGIGGALPQRAGGGLDARRIAVFRMPGGLGVQLAEVGQLFNWQIVAGQVQQGVQQHRTVPVRQHETVAVRPFRIGRVVAQVIVPQHLGNVSHAHGRAWMTGVGFLDGIHT